MGDHKTVEAPIIPLVEGRVYALPNPYPLDGRICTHPIGMRGWAAQNCYLFIEGKHAVLVDTGFSVHEQSMIARLEKLITPDMTFEISVLRLGEYYGVCNVRPLAERFGVRRVYSARKDGLETCDFRPEYVPWGSENAGRFENAENVQIRGNGSVDMGNGRHLVMVSPPLRLLATNWIFDTGTGTLLTSDHFNYVPLEGPDGPWVADARTALPTAAEVREFLVGTRYWWLPGARTAKIIAAMEKLFEKYDVERIGPGVGQILEGADTVASHVGLLRAVLERFPGEPATGVDAGYTKTSLKRAPMAGAK